MRHIAAILGPMTPVHPARHLLRAKDLVDACYFEPLDVPAERERRPRLRELTGERGRECGG
jgi:hypothetical protein